MDQQEEERGFVDQDFSFRIQVSEVADLDPAYPDSVWTPGSG